MAEVKKFLTDFGKYLHLLNMTPGKRRRLDKLVLEGTAGKDYSEMHAALANGEPQPADAAYNFDFVAERAKWDELYLSFQAILRDIDIDKDAAIEKHGKVKNFLDDFYGAGKAIEEFRVSNIVSGIIDPKAAEFETFLKDINVALALEAAGVDQESIEKLADNIANGNYKSDPKLLRTMRQVVAHMHNADPNPNAIPPDPLYSATLFPQQNNQPNPELYQIYKHINTPNNPAPGQVAAFANGNLGKIIAALAKDPKLFEIFSEKDTNRKIAPHLAKGFGKADYSKIAELDRHSPTPFQKAADKVNHLIKEDHLGKLTDRHARRKYFMDGTAKPIVNEILKVEKIPPQKGLDAVLEKADAIKDRLGSDAAKHFDYLITQLKRYKKTSPREFAGALKNGRQLRTIAYGIAEEAAAQGKMEEAKTAFETLAMLRYDNLTTGSWEDWKKNPLEPFKGTSFEKSEPLRIMTQAVTKTLNLALDGMFWAGVSITNGIRTSGQKFSKGTSQVKEMTKAKKELDPQKSITDYENDEKAAKNAYDAAFKSADASDKKVAKLKKEWEHAQLMTKTKRQDLYNQNPQNPAAGASDELKKLQELMMFWDFVNGAKGMTDRNIFRTHRRAQNAFNAEKAAMLNRFYSKHSLAA